MSHCWPISHVTKARFASPIQIRVFFGQNEPEMEATKDNLYSVRGTSVFFSKLLVDSTRQKSKKSLARKTVLGTGFCILFLAFKL